MRQPERAEQLWRELVAFWLEKAGENSPQYARELNSLGMNLIEQGRGAEADPILRQCHRIRQKAEADVWTTFNTSSLLGAALLDQKKYAEAEPLLVAGYEGMKAREAKIPALGKPRLIESLERLVRLYDEWAMPDRSEEWRNKLESERANMANKSARP